MRTVSANLIDNLPAPVKDDLYHRISDIYSIIGAYFVSDSKSTEDFSSRVTVKPIEKQYLARWWWVPKWLVKYPFFGTVYYGIDLSDVESGWVIVVSDK